MRFGGTLYIATPLWNLSLERPHGFDSSLLLLYLGIVGVMDILA